MSAQTPKLTGLFQRPQRQCHCRHPPLLRLGQGAIKQLVQPAGPGWGPPPPAGAPTSTAPRRGGLRHGGLRHGGLRRSICTVDRMSPPALTDSLNGLSRRRLRWPSSAARADCMLSPSTHADCAGPVQLRARTACCPRALMACAVIARLACRGWPAPLTNSGTAVYPRTTRRPQSTRPHRLR
jgi:hypothetical protein